jgi:hypothetical protein
MAQQQPQVAGSGQPDQALRLVPYPSTGSRYFWAAHAVNDDTQQRALEAFARKASRRVRDMLTLGSLYAGSTMLRQEAEKNFMQAQEDGVLLFAWYGSSALEGGAA